MNLFPMRRACVLLALIVTGIPLLHADSAAREIVSRVDTDRQPRTTRSEMTLRVYADAQSDRVSREFKLLTMTRGDEESYTEFLSPTNIAGIRLLQTRDTMLVFFPSTGRVRSITGRARTGSVGGVGGDFTYEDIDAAPLGERFTDFELIDETEARWRISAVPAASGSAYDRVVLYIDKGRTAVVQIDYYVAGEQVKRMETTGFTSVVGRSVPTEFSMINLKAGSRSVLQIDDLEWNILLRDRFFNPDQFHR